MFSLIFILLFCCKGTFSSGATIERKQLQLFPPPPPFFPSCDLNPAGEGENSHVRHVGGAQLCKLHAREVFGMDPLARFVFRGRTQREATFSTLTAATCCSVLLQRNPEAGESHCALALHLQGSWRYQGCAFVPTFFLLLQDVMQVGLGVQMEKRSLEQLGHCFGAGQ